jgi:two-component system sensor histidine kinase BaeS
VQGEDARIQAATIIGSESRRLERLVADLLDLARLDAHEFSLHPRDADAATVVSAAVEAFRPAANDLGIELVVDAPYAVPAHVDPERLGQVVANLVENALKYATRRIRVSVGADARELDVRVVDDGPGIDPAEAPHVFERLYTSRTSPGRQVGTGLGLAIVHELTAAMGGNAWVQPAEGGGTRFVVRMPVVRVTAPG